MNRTPKQIPIKCVCGHKVYFELTVLHDKTYTKLPCQYCGTMLTLPPAFSVKGNEGAKG